MIQKCPNCGAWCSTEKQGFWGRFDRGFGDAAVSGAKIGRAIGSIFGKSGEKAGLFLGGSASGGTFAPANGLLEAFTGDNYHFECPECGYTWSTDDEEDDQTAEYEHEQKILELRDEFPTVSHSQYTEKQQYIKDLRILLASPLNTNAASAVLYDTLAAAYYAIDDRNSALQAVNSSLKLFEDDNTRILKGMIMGKGRNGQDAYSALQEMVYFKQPERSESPFFTNEQIAEEFSHLQSSYAQSFLSIPQQQRKYLVIRDELTYLPQSFRVLPMSEIPTGMNFPVGHPVNDTLYVCHPYKPDTYFPYDSYEVDMLRDEMNEFKSIMDCLGARRIEFHDIVENEQQSSQGSNMSVHGGGNYADKYAAHASYESQRSTDEFKRLYDEFAENKDFALAGTPAIPRDLVWYPHRIDWKRDCESRLAGRLLHNDFVITTSASESTTETERKKIEADLKILMFSGEGGGKGEKTFSLKRERSRMWKVSVDFYPLSDYEKKESVEPLQLASMPSEKPQQKQNWLMWLMGGIILILIIALVIILF